LLGLFTAGVDIRDANNDVNTTDVHAGIYFADHRLSMIVLVSAKPQSICAEIASI
jgi:hypothetical protein